MNEITHGVKNSKGQWMQFGNGLIISGTRRQMLAQADSLNAGSVDAPFVAIELPNGEAKPDDENPDG